MAQRRNYQRRGGGGQPYRGVNSLLLGMDQADKGFSSPWWGTYDQWAQLSGMEKRVNDRTGWSYWASPDGTPRGVRKGEHGTKIVLWKEDVKVEADEVTGEDKPTRRLFARMFTVFNADQVEQAPERYHPQPGVMPEPDTDAQEVLDAYLNSPGGPGFLEDVHGQAHYVPAEDTIHMPPIGEHRSTDRYYSTAFHEAAHSTGHPKRLHRYEVEGDQSPYTGHNRGKEELAAEMGAAFLAAETGVSSDRSEEQTAAYVQSWLTTIKEDRKLVVQAAAAAQKAADRVLEPSLEARRQAEVAAEPEAGPETEQLPGRQDEVQPQAQLEPDGAEAA
jgi:antirestriction protein ArdC